MPKKNRHDCCASRCPATNGCCGAVAATSNDTACARGLDCPVVRWSQRNERRFMMNHTDGWMGGWMGGWMWIWTVIRAVVVVLLVVVINNLSKKKSSIRDPPVNAGLKLRQLAGVKVYQ